MSKKIHISSRGIGKVDKDGKITDYTLLSYDLVTPPTKMKKSIKIKSTYPLWKRIWVLIKNPFTYIFCGYEEH